MDLRPFTVEVAESEITDLRERLARTRYAEEIPGSGWDYGTPPSYLKPLCEYWADGYDWRAAEKQLNSWPQYRTVVDGLDVHLGLATE